MELIYIWIYVNSNTLVDIRDLGALKPKRIPILVFRASICAIEQGNFDVVNRSNITKSTI